MDAVRSDNTKPELIEAMLENGHSITAKDKLGRNVFCMAAYTGRLWVLKYLVDHHGNKFDVNAQSDNGMTALHWAALEKQESTFEYLSHQFEDLIQARDHKNRTPQDITDELKCS